MTSLGILHFFNAKINRRRTLGEKIHEMYGCFHHHVIIVGGGYEYNEPTFHQIKFSFLEKDGAP